MRHTPSTTICRLAERIRVNAPRLKPKDAQAIVQDSAARQLAFLDAAGDAEGAESAAAAALMTSSSHDDWMAWWKVFRKHSLAAEQQRQQKED